MCAATLRHTDATGAYVEWEEAAEFGGMVRVVAAMGQGAPPTGTRAPYPGSLTEEIIESGDAHRIIAVSAVGRSMAPYLQESCGRCMALIIPLSPEDRTLGALVLLGEEARAPFRAEEATTARALGDAASAALRRIVLLEALRESELRFRSLVGATAAIVWTTSPSGLFTTAQPEWSAFTGQPTNELLENGWIEAIHPDDRTATARAWSRAVETRSMYQWEHRLRRHDGEYRHMLVRAIPIADEEGNVREWVGIHTDITDQHRHAEERERLLAREREARAEADAAVQLRDEMLSLVSHDLRNPLGTIVMSSSFLLDILPDDEQRKVERKQLEIIRRAAESMSRIIQDLLDIARIESGRLVVERVPTPVRPVIKDAVTMLRPLAEEAGITLRSSVSEDVPLICADRDRLLQILSNLVGNAIKFTPAGGIVSITVEPDRDGIRCRVSDTGEGIAAEQLPHLFDRYWQATRTDRRGLGLGLAIVHRLVQAHGGDIRVESEQGRGTTFTFIIPGADGGCGERDDEGRS